MTNLDEFFEALAKTKNLFNWYIDTGGAIRAESRWAPRTPACFHCPVSAVYEVETGVKKTFMEAAKLGPLLGLTQQLTDQLVDCADMKLFVFEEDSIIRQRMIDTLGLRMP